MLLTFFTRNTPTTSLRTHPGSGIAGFCPRSTTMTRRRLSHSSTCTYASNSVLPAGSVNGSIASPRSSAVAVPDFVSFSTSSTVDPAGAFRAITVCADATPAPASAMSAAAQTTARHRFSMQTLSLDT